MSQIIVSAICNEQYKYVPNKIKTKILKIKIGLEILKRYTIRKTIIFSSLYLKFLIIYRAFKKRMAKPRNPYSHNSIN